MSSKKKKKMTAGSVCDASTGLLQQSVTAAATIPSKQAPNQSPSPSPSAASVASKSSGKKKNKQATDSNTSGHDGGTGAGVEVGRRQRDAAGVSGAEGTADGGGGGGGGSTCGGQNSSSSRSRSDNTTSSPSALLHSSRLSHLIPLVKSSSKNSKMGPDGRRLNNSESEEVPVDCSFGRRRNHTSGSDDRSDDVVNITASNRMYHVVGREDAEVGRGAAVKTPASAMNGVGSSRVSSVDSDWSSLPAMRSAALAHNSTSMSSIASSNSNNESRSDSLSPPVAAVTTTGQQTRRKTPATTAQRQAPPTCPTPPAHAADQMQQLPAAGPSDRLSHALPDREERVKQLARLANTLIDDGMMLDAISLLDVAIHIDDSDYRLFINRAYCNEVLGKCELALRDANKAVELRPEWANCHFRRGKALVGMELFNEAEEAFAKSLEFTDPRDIVMKEDLMQEMFGVRLNACLNWGFPEGEARAAASQASSVVEAYRLVVENSTDLQQNVPDSDPPISAGSVTSTSSSSLSTQSAQPSPSASTATLASFWPKTLSSGSLGASTSSTVTPASDDSRHPSRVSESSRTSEKKNKTKKKDSLDQEGELDRRSGPTPLIPKVAAAAVVSTPGSKMQTAAAAVNGKAVARPTNGRADHDHLHHLLSQLGNQKSQQQQYHRQQAPPSSLVPGVMRINLDSDDIESNNSKNNGTINSTTTLSQKEILVETVITMKQLFYWCPDLESRNECDYFALWIGNISPNCSNDLLREMFIIFGDLVHCKVYPKDDFNDVSYALAHYDNDKSPILAMAEYQGAVLRGVSAKDKLPLVLRFRPNKEQKERERLGAFGGNNGNNNINWSTMAASSGNNHIVSSDVTAIRRASSSGDVVPGAGSAAGNNHRSSPDLGNSNKKTTPVPPHGECYFWRTTGCRNEAAGCRYAHYPSSKGIDYAPFMKKQSCTTTSASSSCHASTSNNNLPPGGRSHRK